LLAGSLETAPSNGSGWTALDDGRQVRPILSFQSHSGAWCREYLISGPGGELHGVACRGDKGWTSQISVNTHLHESAAEYRPASALDSDEVASFIDQNAADIPLDAKQEAELIARQWQ
jgi:hypothetical protein